MMNTPPTSKSDTPQSKKSLHSRSWNTGKAAFKLIGQHRTSADPKSYAVWYEYALGKNEDLNAAIDKTLALEQGISSAELRQLHETFLAASPDAERTLEGISQEIENKVAGAQTLVSEVISNTNEYVFSMDKAKSNLPAASSPEQIMQALDEIIDQTKSSQESAQTIQVALQSTHDEITQLSSRVGQLRSNLKRDSLTKLVNLDRFETLLAEGSADALRNGYSLTVLVVSAKNIQDLCLTADLDISEFILKSLAEIMTEIVGEHGTCARIGGSELAIMLPKAAYAEASKMAKQIIEELDNFRIVKKPSEQLVGYIQCAFGGSSFKAGLLPKDLIRIAADQASQAKFSNKSHVKFDLTNHQAA